MIWEDLNYPQTYDRVALCCPPNIDGYGSKPINPFRSHQNRWIFMDVHPKIKRFHRYWPIPRWRASGSAGPPFSARKGTRWFGQETEAGCPSSPEGLPGSVPETTVNQITYLILPCVFSLRMNLETNFCFDQFYISGSRMGIWPGVKNQQLEIAARKPYNKNLQASFKYL